MMFGHHLFLVFLAILIIWFCWMISLIFAGRFHLSTSLRSVSTLLILSHTFAHSSVLPLDAFKLITGRSLLTMPCTTCSLPTASSSISPVPTLPHKMAKLNVCFVPSITLCAPCSSMRPCPPSTGLRPLQPPHTCLTGAPPLPFATKSRTLVCTNLLPPMSIYVSLDAFVTPIYRPHPRISLRRVPLPVCFWVPLCSQGISLFGSLHAPDHHLSSCCI